MHTRRAAGKLNRAACPGLQNFQMPTPSAARCVLRSLQFALSHQSTDSLARTQPTQPHFPHAHTHQSQYFPRCAFLQRLRIRVTHANTLTLTHSLTHSLTHGTLTRTLPQWVSIHKASLHPCPTHTCMRNSPPT